jgi:CheY-like chemotaxis protein/anti-sigma regulatory factor (Ser/Thr protein kinase)
MARVLVVEDSRTQALQIQLLLEEAGFEVGLAGNGREALAVLARGEPDVILTDLTMPEMNGLELVEAVRDRRPAVPVVLMTAQGSEEIAVEALKKGAASYIPKRLLRQSLVETLEGVLSVSQASKHQERLLDTLVQAEFSFVLENDVNLVPALIGYLEASVARVLRCERADLLRVGVALNEALVNAIQHGNLEVSSELRQHDDERDFRALTEARRRQPPYSERRVRISARVSATEVVYVVADEGPGFDPRALPDPTDPANLERIGGRGLMLIRTFMDKVEYNTRGNQITMLKRRRQDRSEPEA